MADKSADNLIYGINKSKQNTLPQFIYAIGIRHVGAHAADVLAENFKSIDKLAGSSIEELSNIFEIGSIMAKSIHSFFNISNTKKVIEKFRKVGLNFYYKRLERKGKLSGQRFVFTGELSSFTRPEAGRLVKELGGNVSDTISKKIDFLVAGEKPGSKLNKAQKLGIQIIDEKKFKQMIAG